MNGAQGINQGCVINEFVRSQSHLLQKLEDVNDERSLENWILSVSVPHRS